MRQVRRSLLGAGCLRVVAHEAQHPAAGGPGHLGRLGSGDLRPEPGPRPAQRGLDAPGVGPHDLGDVGVGHALHLPHHEDGPLAGRQRLERPVDHRGHHVPGNRLPHVVGSRDALEFRKLTGVGQGGLADVAPSLVDAEVPGDPKQPVLELVLAVEPAEGLECPDEDLLGQVLGVGSAIGEVGDERVDPRVVALVQDGGGFLTPVLRLVDERTVGPGVGVGLKVKNALCYCHSALTPDSQTQPASTEPTARLHNGRPRHLRDCKFRRGIG